MDTGQTDREDRVMRMDTPFEKWLVENCQQVAFSPEIREWLAKAFEGGAKTSNDLETKIAELAYQVKWYREMDETFLRMLKLTIDTHAVASMTPKDWRQK